MALPPEIRARAEEHVALFCQNRIPEAMREQVRLEHRCRGNAITLSECRAPWREDLGAGWTRQEVAQFRYEPKDGTWTLYWVHQSGWLRYDGLDPAGDIGPLLAEVGEDPRGCFWG